MYKIELHMHTKYGSGCGQMEEKALVDGYLKAGYQAVVVTDHFCRDSFNYMGIAPGEKAACLERFLEGYRRVKAEGEARGLKVYRGAEIRFDENFNDYLLFGYSDELLSDPEEIFSMGLEAFIQRVRAEGTLLIQAHPFRWMCTPADLNCLDGVEVRNMHPGHSSCNEKAVEYAARKPGLVLTSGSDCHEPHHLGRGGILAEALPEDEKALVALLRSGKYTLLGGEE